MDRLRGQRESQHASDWVYDRLREMIVGGEIAPNERLVELQLAARFGVSRTPVREALKRLEAEDAVALDPQRGLVVRGIESAELQEIEVIRHALVALSTQLAAERVTLSNLSRLRGLLRRMRKSVLAGQWDEVMRLDGDFRACVRHLAGNARLSRLLRDLEESVHPYLALADSDRARWSATLSEHERLLRDLETHSGIQAEAILPRSTDGGRTRQRRHQETDIG